MAPLKRRVKRLLVRISASNAKHFLTDANNNTLALADATQTLSTRYSYDVYGQSTQTTLSGTPSDNSQQYTGRENDGTGLYYYRARYYHAGCARFISEDPIGWASGQTNNYAYVGGDPVGQSDPWGLQAIPLPLPTPVPGVPNPSADAQRDLAERITRSISNQCSKSYQTYTRYNPNTHQCYSGRTSGCGSPQQNVANRTAQQSGLTAEGFSPGVLDRSSHNEGSIRGREQQMIDLNGGAWSSGGTSRNLINGISKINPYRQRYLDAATQEFGTPVSGNYCTAK